MVWLVVADKAPGLELMNQRVELVVTVVKGLLPLLMVPVAVEPDAAHLAVTGQQLGQLALHEVKIRIRVGGLWPSGLLSGTSARCIGAAPVYQRVVEMQRHVLTLALGGQLGYDVALERGGIHDVVISAFAVEH